MNKIVKAVANGQKVELKDLFNSVNNFELTRLREYTEEGHLIMSIQINKFTEYKDSYGFSQSCTMFDDIAYNLKKEDILSIHLNRLQVGLLRLVQMNLLLTHRLLQRI